MKANWDEPPRCFAKTAALSRPVAGSALFQKGAVALGPSRWLCRCSPTTWPWRQPAHSGRHATLLGSRTSSSSRSHPAGWRPRPGQLRWPAGATLPRRRVLVAAARAARGPQLALRRVVASAPRRRRSQHHCTRRTPSGAPACLPPPPPLDAVEAGVPRCRGRQLGSRCRPDAASAIPMRRRGAAGALRSPVRLRSERLRTVERARLAVRRRANTCHPPLPGRAPPPWSSAPCIKIRPATLTGPGRRSAPATPALRQGSGATEATVRRGLILSNSPFAGPPRTPS